MNDPGVVEWLRGPAGEQWSRDRALAQDPGPVVCMQVLWRARGPLDAGSDPCGRPPVRVAVTARKDRLTEQAKGRAS